MHTLLKARNKQRKSLNILKGINSKELIHLFFFCSINFLGYIYGSEILIVKEYVVLKKILIMKCCFQTIVFFAYCGLFINAFSYFLDFIFIL